MANCIEFEGKGYSVNEFKTALLNGEFERLHRAEALSLPNANKIFNNLKSEKKSVLDKDIKDVSIDDIVNEIKNHPARKKLATKDISNDTLKSGDKKSIDTYVSRASNVLKSLFPNATLETFNNTEDYVKEGGTEDTRGIGLLEKDGKHRILLNLEKIAEDNSGKTAYHEVIHPILYEAYTTKADQLNVLWNDVADAMKDVKGMDKVFQHASLYSSKEAGMEGLTELIAQVADGNIDLKEAKIPVIQKALELINKLFKTLGINVKLNNVEDFTNFANKIKEAFETGDTSGINLKGNNIDEVYAQLEKTKDKSSDTYKQLLDLLDKKISIELQSGNISQEDADKIYKSLNYDSPYKTRVSGEKRIGQESIQAQSIESSSQEAVSPSRDVQSNEEEVIPDDNRTEQQQQEAEQDYNNREQQVRGYARSENISLTEDEIDHATALVDEDTTPKEAIAHVQEETKKEIAEAGKQMADAIRKLRFNKSNKAYATIFGLPIAVYDTAIVTIANAVEATGNLAQAISDGINYIKSKVADWEDDGGYFAKHIEDAIKGEKPKLKIQVEAEKTEPTAEETEKEKAKEAKKELDNYDITTSSETNKFLSGETWEDVFGERPEGNQSYAVQKLADMLQDGKNMIAIAQQKWGNDIMDYGRKLFSYIQNMERVSSNADTNKKAVLLATFLGEIKEAIEREPARANEIRKLEAPVMAYYQHYMNVKGKQVVAGRLLRLYRDKYLGDVFANRILEEEQVRGRDAVQQAEKNIKITDEVVTETSKPITEEQKKEEEKKDTERKKESDKNQEKKKSMSQSEAQQKANEKLKEIEQKLGNDKEKGLIAKINDLIKKINCP